ncbi:MAG: indolepyruvate oxidoreductase subunit beta [Defluviitaleaceae bacterium]|nr:indolepyruvate oxidoreductase subunit beta [Defluviitaleaceae bacterium]
MSTANDNNTSILISGVGGQGTLLASRIIGGVAIRDGCDVKVSEVHGMSQRGGSVTTFVRFGRGRVCSPVIDDGQADFVLAFELLEAYRSVSYLKPGGRIVVNNLAINPMPVITGEAAYPDGIIEKIRGFGFGADTLDASGIAKKAGSERAANVALIGRLAPMLPFKKDSWVEVIKESVKPAFLELNLKAFELGYGYDG